MKLVSGKGDENMKNLNILMNMFKMTEMQLKKYVAKELRKTYEKVEVGDGYVFAKGNVPVLLVAHLDTVHKQAPTIFVYANGKNKITSPQGIGGDDRNGVFSVLETIKRHKCSVLFCEQEEVGGVGAEKFTQTKLAKELEFNYIIEFDRKGSNDAVFYDCDNPEFEEFITKEFYKTAFGSFSDISILAPFFGCAAVNLSCGYYNAHTTNEYIVPTEIEASINAACKILERTTEADKFEYLEAKYTSSYYGSYGYGGWYDGDEMYYIIEYLDENDQTQWFDLFARSTEEAIGKFCIEFENIPYCNIMDICIDENIYM